MTDNCTAITHINHVPYACAMRRLLSYNIFSPPEGKRFYHPYLSGGFLTRLGYFFGLTACYICYFPLCFRPHINIPMCFHNHRFFWNRFRTFSPFRLFIVLLSLITHHLWTNINVFRPIPLIFVLLFQKLS